MSENLQKLCWDLSYCAMYSIRNKIGFEFADKTYPVAMQAWRKQSRATDGHSDEEICILMSEALVND